MTFDYLENVPNIAATVCDKEGIILYQNKRAIDRDGDVVGKNLYNCHGEKAGAMIRYMIESVESNTYQIIRHENISFFTRHHGMMQREMLQD